MLNFMNMEKINKTLYRLNNNKVRKWSDKSKYHANKINGYIANKNNGYMHKYETILNHMYIKHHSRLANYYLNRARIGDEALEYMKMRAEELDIKLD